MDAREEVTKATKTHITTVSVPFGEPFQVVLSVPSTRPVVDNEQARRAGSNTVPITCHISKQGSAESLGAYVYSILEPKRQEVYQSLLNNSEEDILEICKRFGTVICKKYHVPVYMSVSGKIGFEEGTMYLTAIIKEIESMFESSDS